jgi:DNA-binding response OmpR family regulator
MNQRVLVVDDEPQIRRVLCLVLRANGYDVAGLRTKLESNPARPRIIVTEPGIGYRLQVD